MTNINILHSQIYYDDCSCLIPKTAGAYVITHTVDYIHAGRYIGSTKNLSNRITNHCNRDILYIDLYITNDIILAKSLEMILIKLMKPASNKIILPLSKDDKELMNGLLKDTNIKDYMSNNIVKIGYRYLKYISISRKESIDRSVCSKTIHISDAVYSKLNEIKLELKKIGVELTLHQIIDISYKCGIENVIEFIKNN